MKFCHCIDNVLLNYWNFIGCLNISKRGTFCVFLVFVFKNTLLIWSVLWLYIKFGNPFFCFHRVSKETLKNFRGTLKASRVWGYFKRHSLDLEAWCGYDTKSDLWDPWNAGKSSARIVFLPVKYISGRSFYHNENKINFQ